MNKLKVSTQLSLGFGTLLLLILAMGAVSLVKVNSIHQSFQLVVDDRVPKVAEVNGIKSDINVIALSMRNMVILADPAETKKELAQLEAARQAIAKRLETLHGQISSERGKVELAKVEAARGKYVPMQGKFVELVTAGKADEAKALLVNEVRSAQHEYLAALDHLLKYQDDLMQISEHETGAHVSSMTVAIWTLGLISLVVGTLTAVWITRSLSRQLGGEPGDAADLARAVAQGDLSVPITVKAGDQTSLMASLQGMQMSLTAVVGNVRQGSESVATASAQISQGNNELSQRTEEQASALEQTAASMEQLGSTVRMNADNARQANQLAQSASEVAVKGGQVVSQVVETMKGINDSSKKIADIIGVIDGIAFQTNILALNAAVEAARAGEQGRGFAVVASKVRSLAGRSAEAAKEIKSLIGASVERVQQGSTLVDQAGVTMTEVVNSIQRVTDIMGEISAASSEQSTGVSQIGEAVTQMDQVTQQNAALVEESAAAAESLKMQAEQLVQSVAVFKLASNAVRAPAAAPKPSNVHKFVERPASNVARPVFAKPKPVGAQPAPQAAVVRSEPVPAPASRTGTDDWESF
jgi:methyl-accepting chemotaxis protein